EPTEIVNLRITAIGVVERPSVSGVEAGGEEPDGAAYVGESDTYFKGEGKARRTPLFVRDRLRAGNRIFGPAIIVEPTATTVVEPDFVVEVLSEGQLRLRLES